VPPFAFRISHPARFGVLALSAPAASPPSSRGRIALAVNDPERPWHPGVSERVDPRNAEGEPIMAGTQVKVRMIALDRIAHG